MYPEADIGWLAFPDGPGWLNMVATTVLWLACTAAFILLFVGIHFLMEKAEARRDRREG